MSTLVIYATKHGAAEKCASMLSKKLAGRVVLHNLKSGVRADLPEYERIIIGGSIYAGRIQKEVTDFCVQNEKLLKGKKVGVYICCIFKNNAEIQLSNAFPKSILDNAAAKGSFGGEMRFSDMSFGEKLLTKMVSKTITISNPELASIDTKKDFSAICTAEIDKFAEAMNNA